MRKSYLTVMILILLFTISGITVHAEESTTALVSIKKLDVQKRSVNLPDANPAHKINIINDNDFGRQLSPNAECIVALESNYGDPKFYWEIPDEYNDTKFGQKIPVSGDTCYLQQVCWYLYDAAPNVTFLETITIEVFADAGGLPAATPLGSLPISPVDFAYHPNSVCVDFSSLNIALVDDFWVTITFTGNDTIAVLSDSSGTGMVGGAAEVWNGIWGLMSDDWGLDPDIAFLVDVELCCTEPPLDTDSDGDPDATDPDDDNDGVLDANDFDPLDPYVCEDIDNDGCDDCSIGSDGFGPEADNNPDNDGPDTDADGICNNSDPDDDNDGVDDANDSDPNDPSVCEDIDNDGCDDCSVGTDGFGPEADNNPANDGTDTDGDGICNISDQDDDDDGVLDINDSDPTDPYVCADIDNDGCEDCTTGLNDPSNDGPDADGDGICDLTDNCIDVINPGQEDIDNDGIGDVCDLGCCGAYTNGFTGNTTCDEGGLRDLADITRLIDNVYISKLDLCCPENGNINGDGAGLINLADITKLIDHVYITKTPTEACF